MLELFFLQHDFSIVIQNSKGIYSPNPNWKGFFWQGTVFHLFGFVVCLKGFGLEDPANFPTRIAAISSIWGCWFPLWFPPNLCPCPSIYVQVCCCILRDLFIIILFIVTYINISIYVCLYFSTIHVDLHLYICFQIQIHIYIDIVVISFAGVYFFTPFPLQLGTPFHILDSSRFFVIAFGSYPSVDLAPVGRYCVVGRYM